MSHNEKILIVDDECRICDSLKDLLSAQGYEMKTCGNGHDAMAYLTEDTFDLVLLDIVMEEMDGFKVMERMACQHLDIPVIIITGNASTASAVEALRKGAYDYLRKPFEPDELYTSVKNALNQRMLKKDNDRVNRQLQKAESLGRMAGAIAHHFNNQLMVVTGNLELVMEDLPAGNTFVTYLAEAKKAARRAAEVSGLMLTYLGQTTVQQEPMDICEVCNLSLSLLQATLPKRIHLETNLALPGPVINGNVNQIQQVLANLITNAQEAAGDSLGAIELTVRTVSATEIPATFCFPIGWQPLDNVYACLEVADAGCGIAGKDIEKIFDPFFTTKFAGRGLGLSVVLGILKTHHGAITMKSEPGRGTIFQIFLPVSTEALIRSPEKTAITPGTQWDGTVLIVEGDESVRKMTKMMLTRLGLTVLEARDGIEAVEVFHPHRDEIRCVLSDLTMPRMDGWETLSSLRNLSPGIPVVLVSGYNESQVMAGDHSEWPDAFLHKPFSMKDLAAVIRQVLVQK